MSPPLLAPSWTLLSHWRARCCTWTAPTATSGARQPTAQPTLLSWARPWTLPWNPVCTDLSKKVMVRLGDPTKLLPLVMGRIIARLWKKRWISFSLISSYESHLIYIKLTLVFFQILQQQPRTESSQQPWSHLLTWLTAVGTNMSTDPTVRQMLTKTSAPPCAPLITPMWPAKTATSLCWTQACATWEPWTWRQVYLPILLRVLTLV